MTTCAWPPQLSEFIEAMLPPMADLVAIKGPLDMGPKVEIPAIYVHLLLSRIRVLEASLETRDLELRLALPPPVSPTMTDEQTTDYAGRLGQHIFANTADPSRAAGILWQACVAVMIAMMPRDFVFGAIDKMARDSMQAVRDAIGVGRVRQ